MEIIKKFSDLINFFQEKICKTEHAAKRELWLIFCYTKFCEKLHTKWIKDSGESVEELQQLFAAIQNPISAEHLTGWKKEFYEICFKTADSLIKEHAFESYGEFFCYFTAPLLNGEPNEVALETIFRRMAIIINDIVFYPGPIEHLPGFTEAES